MTLPYANSATKGHPMERKIITEYWAKPIPIRDFDWIAYFDGDEPNDDGQMRHGYGSSEQKAINELNDSNISDYVESSERGRGKTWLLGWIVCSGFVLTVAALMWAVR